jgi:HSP20 family protein
MGLIFESHESSDRTPADLERLRRSPFESSRWSMWQTGQAGQTWRPPTDVFETDDAVIVRVEIAGMRDADFLIALHDQLLTISGQRADPAAKVAYHQLEVRYGEFRTEVYLHWSVEQADISAVYQDGFLIVTMPKARLRQVRVVDVSE